MHLDVTETLTADAPGTSITQQIVVVPPAIPPAGPVAQSLSATATFNVLAGAGSTTLFVEPPPPQGLGNDLNGPCTQNLPCATINRALEFARDGDTIQVGAGRYDIARTIVVTKLVTIQPGTTSTNSGRTVLIARPGVTIFEVRAQGGPATNQHVVIQNFTMGGNILAGSSAPAILLVNDSYTDINNNIIGAEGLRPTNLTATPSAGSPTSTPTPTPTPFPQENLGINNGIVLSNSDHTNIRNNTIQGSVRFTFTPVLTVGKNVTGFGVVTSECIGGAPDGVSDSVTISTNLFTNVWLAGIWLCSDGAGEHNIDGNVFRNNWRGIVLKDITNSTVQNNTLIDGKSDGIVLYGASLRNTITKNRVESHVAASAAAIRIGWLADPIVPLANDVTSNQLVRDTVGIHVFGARTTLITGNEIKITGVRTGILITPSSFPLDPSTQPRDTEITGGNRIIFNGPCGPVFGCAIRLVGVSVPVRADGNDYGLRRAADVEGFIWHKVDDPTLGLVTFTPFTNQREEPTPSPSPVPSVIPTSVTTTTRTPNVTPTTGATPSATPTPPGGGDNTAVVTLDLVSGCNPENWRGPNDYLVSDALMGITPPEAQRTATIWRLQGGEWMGWSAATSAPTDVFLLQSNEQLLVCVDRPSRWQVPLLVGGP